MRFAAALLLGLFMTAAVCGCLRSAPEWGPMKYASPAPNNLWKPLPSQKEAATQPMPARTIPPELQPSATPMGLARLVDIALLNNPSTRLAWEQARYAAAAWAQSRSGYYPSLSGGVSFITNKGAASGGSRSHNEEIGQAGVTLSYLLLDFGGRNAEAEAARQALFAANWSHNQSIQDVLRDVPDAYYTYLGNKALIEADEVSLSEAKTSFEAAEQRRRAGVGTIADVLQAKANMQEARYTLEADRGTMEISRGNLATTVGWPANTPFQVEIPTDDLPIENLSRNIDALIDLGRSHRPDLASYRALVRQKEAQLRQAESDLWPQLVIVGSSDAGASAGQEIVWMDGEQDHSITYSAGIQLQIPLFEGFSLRNGVRKARADLEAARASLRVQEETVISEVWSAYYNFRTAAELLTASEALLESAMSSFEASLARYRAGAADIVELLNAQTLLSTARSQHITSKTNLYVSYADLVHAVGTELPGALSGEENGNDNPTGNVLYGKN